MKYKLGQEVEYNTRFRRWTFEHEGRCTHIDDYEH